MRPRRLEGGLGLTGEGGGEVELLFPERAPPGALPHREEPAQAA